MRRALVVFESMFGNTQTIAEAVAEGLSSRIPTDLLEVGAASDVLTDVDLLVVGGPTHAFGMSRPRTREDATRQAGGHVVSERTGLREWLTSVKRSTGTVAAAAFDTRIEKPRVPGSAAHGAEKRMRKLGFRIAAPSESFYVTGVAGPLVDGEADRALRWGQELGEGCGAGTEEQELRSTSDDVGTTR
ncbi:MAG TPA: flavodoxin domain-containing protein [Actinomycetota bacterium]|nr:flavodoxin domain-containing protein [Actinomycetota bacterium]